MYYIDLSNDNIVDVNSDHSQVLRIDCDAPVTTDQIIDQTAEQTTIYSSTTETSTTTSLQTTDSIQSTTMRTKEDTIANDQITGNTIGINVVNRHTMLKLTKIFTKTCITNRRFAISNILYQCRKTDYWVDDTLGTNSPSSNISTP